MKTGQRSTVRCPIRCALAMHCLSHANVCVVQLWCPGNDLKSDERSSRMCHEVNLLFVKTVQQVASNRQCVGYDLFQRQRFWRDVRAIGEPSTPLVPPDHRKFVFQACGITLRKEVLPRQTPMENEQHRIRCILALNEHSLPHTVDIGKSLLQNAVAQRAVVCIQERPRSSAAQQLQRAHKTECATQGGQRFPPSRDRRHSKRTHLAATCGRAGPATAGRSPCGW